MNDLAMGTNEIAQCFLVLGQDRRLNVWHMALLSAICVLGLEQGRRKSIRVSRSKMMLLSHINTLPTFHKYFKQLQDMEYIIYRPCYHPGVRSEIDIVV